MTATPESAIEFARKNGAEFVDFRFTDLLGAWHHITVPIHRFDEDIFDEGKGFDGSSIRAWRSIESSDMLLKADPSTVQMDPFSARPTIVAICDVVETGTHQAYNRDPRGVAKRAEAYLQSTGLADTAYFGPEAEFFIFDEVQFHQGRHEAFYTIDSSEGAWNSGAQLPGGNRGHRPGWKGGYFPVSPVDSQSDIRNDMCVAMAGVGIDVETQHHEVGTGGQAEIDIRFNTLLKTADQLQWFKYIVRNVAHSHGKSATFMPKPLFEDNGSGMHTHQSLWKNGVPLFAGEAYADLSQMALYYIGGILKHAPALAAFTNPITNSYRRLVPGYEAPNRLAYSSRNRSAAIRIPTYHSSPKGVRLEYRTPDPAACGYLAFAAMLMAGLDGVLNRIDPGDPMDQNIYDLPAEVAKNIPEAPGTLDAALNALENDHAFLLAGDVFNTDLIEGYLDFKRTEEVAAMRARPTPYEFQLYYSV